VKLLGRRRHSSSSGLPSPPGEFEDLASAEYCQAIESGAGSPPHPPTRRAGFGSNLVLIGERLLQTIRVSTHANVLPNGKLVGVPLKDAEHAKDTAGTMPLLSAMVSGICEVTQARIPWRAAQHSRKRMARDSGQEAKAACKRIELGWLRNEG